MSSNPRLSPLAKRVLAEWHGCDEPLDVHAGVHRAADMLDSILRASGMQDGLLQQEVIDAWKKLAGEVVASHSAPVSIRNGHLILRVTQPTMRHHLEQMKPLLLKRLQSVLGAEAIRSIQFSLG
ncbi:MAG: DUF721 domain-containing protein [Verrucomicrobia bacterium]|nr:MAG: DUF721 domain-containing protein [Verrucomicrobiota bacterium]